MDSILDSVKAHLGLTPDYTHFDDQIIMDINTVFSILAQLGVGDDAGFSISNNEAVWSDYLPEGLNLEMVKSYMAKKVQLLFDPPLGSAVLDASNRIISELEWRIQVSADPVEESDDEEEDG